MATAEDTSDLRPPAGARRPWADISPLRSWTAYVLALVALLAGVDRQVFATLLVPIQKDIGASDAAMGALTGSSYAVVYAIAALPLARLADRVNRRNLLAGVVGFWSLATALCGWAGSYATLLLARIGVAGAESAQLPTTMSLIGDRFTASRRGAAIGLVIVGSSFGYAGGAALGGFLNDLFNWKIALMFVGVPGLLVAALVFLTMPEPPRGAAGDQISAAVKGSFAGTLKRCLKSRSLRLMAVGFVCLQACFQGWLVWMPPFLMRVHHLSATKMGVIFGGAIAGAAISNIVAGGLSDRLARNRPRWRPWLCVLIVVLSVPPMAAISLAAGLQAAIVLMLVYTVVSGGLTTATAVTYISLAPPDMRGMVTAVMNLLGNVVGGLMGPMIFGLINDGLTPRFGDQALRYTLLLAPALMAVSGLLFLMSARTYEADLREAERAA